jgi:hypothetical protein
MGAQTSKCDGDNSKTQGILVLKSDGRPKTFLQNLKLSCKADVLPDDVKAIIASLGLDSGDFYKVDVKYDLAVIVPSAVAAALFLILLVVLAARRRRPVVME